MCDSSQFEYMDLIGQALVIESKIVIIKISVITDIQIQIRSTKGLYNLIGLKDLITIIFIDCGCKVYKPKVLKVVIFNN